MSKIVLPLRMRVGRYNAQIAIKNRAVSPDRKVACFEIEVPIEKGGISYISGQTRPITKDLVICAKPGDLRHTRLPYKCYYLHIAVREGLLFDTLTRLPPFVENADTEHIRGLFEKLCRCHVSERAENEFLQQSLLLELVYEIQAAARGGQKKRGQQAVDAASAYIKKNLTAELDLATVASEVKFAPSYFDKLFKAATGKTLHRY
ncbi:MAG: hypothetical protein IJU41_06560, partial [Clostridia bacterium]|nr:hypothetical protein [Clostridia bacterium]